VRIVRNKALPFPISASSRTGIDLMSASDEEFKVRRSCLGSAENASVEALRGKQSAQSTYSCLRVHDEIGHSSYAQRCGSIRD